MRTPGNYKRGPRIDVRKPAIIVNSDGAEVRATILDVSSTGFRATIAEDLRIGEFVTLRCDHEDTPAQIRWVLGNEAGASFLSPTTAGFQVT